METEKLFSTYAEYEKYVLENRDKLIDYIKKNDVPLRNLQISARTYNTLRVNGIELMSNLVFMPSDEINNLDAANKSAVAEILMFKRNYLRKHKKAIADFLNGNITSNTAGQENIHIEKAEKELSTNESVIKNVAISNSSLDQVKALLCDKSAKDKISEFAKNKQTEIGDLDISNRTYYALRRANIRFLHEAISLYPDGFNSIRNFGQKSVDEICNVIENYLFDKYAEISSYIGGVPVELQTKKDSSEETDPFKLTISELLCHPLFKEKALMYIQRNDIPVEQMGLGVRSVNAFKHAGILTFSAALKIYPHDLSALRNIGTKSMDEIRSRMEYYLAKLQNTVSAYCSGDQEAMYSNEFICDKVMSCFKDVGFAGISCKQIIEEFPEDIDEKRIKKCIGSLIAENKLEYVDFRIYRVYPSVYSVLEKSKLYEEDKDILFKKLRGMTLEAIAQEYDVTRERIRQKFDKNFRKLRNELKVKYGLSFFDEDYYSYLYSHYEVIKEMWFDYLGITKETFNYLMYSHIRGKAQITEALSDPKVDLILKYKIQDYLNRNKVLIDGILIDRQRSDIENYVLSKVARDEVTYGEFAEVYNDFLRNNGIDFDEKLYYTDEIRRSRSNRLSDSMYCLWKQGEKLRYYDIVGQDYTELLETLNLSEFNDIELSTLKFFEEYPEVMEKYDIRDQYELHNLLKKIVDVGNYHEMVFHRQPMIQFGRFDRAKALYSILEAVSPVTAEELVEYIHMEYGYDKATTMWSYLQLLNQFYHQGIYSIDFKRIPENRISTLNARLTDSFYYISEIKSIYEKLFDDADLDEINPLSLKSMGFIVFATYAIKNYHTAESFFTNLLTSQDVYDVSQYNSKFINIKTYYCTYYALRQNYDIFLFDKNNVITINRLNKLGIVKDDIYCFCDQVEQFVETGVFFTIHSLKGAGFESDLDDLGFDDYFYASILAMDSRFSWQRIFGEIVLLLKAGSGDETISKKTFFYYMLSKYDSVDLEDFIGDCLEEYGIKISDKYEINNAIKDTEFYYDSIMDKIYKNKNYYYAEFDD